MGENGSPKLVGAHDESLRVAQIRTFRKLGWELSIIMSDMIDSCQEKNTLPSLILKEQGF